MSEVNETKPKKRNISIRVASSSTDLKRKFFENSMCALNLRTPGKLHKRSAPKIASKSTKTHDQSISKQPATQKEQPSIFHEVASQLEARDWVEQVRVANQQLNQSLFSSVEYDGDAFLPSGIIKLRVY